MRLTPIQDDFVLTTLQGVAGCLGKLDYLTSLRDDAGVIQHWGLEKIHGEKQARGALDSAYAGLLRELLETPLRSIWQEVEDQCAENGMAGTEYVLGLKARLEQHLPRHLSKAQRQHLMLILDVLCALAEKGQASPVA